MTKNVMLLTGAGQIGMAIARRMGYGMKIIVGDKKKENADAITKILNEAGFDRMKLNFGFIITAHNRAYNINRYLPIIFKESFVNFSFDVIESCINACSVLC